MSEICMKLSVPGNILIAGEYLITLSGAMGLSIASEPSVITQAHYSDAWEIESVINTKKTSIKNLSSGTELVSIVFRECEKYFVENGYEHKPLSISIDSSSFFDEKGNKLGFGSSAAVSVSLAMVLCRNALGLEHKDFMQTVCALALKSHRIFQGGSGYDIFTSLYGGLLLFVGGKEPSYIPLQTNILPQIFTYKGRAPVSSKDAVSKFCKWCELQVSNSTGSAKCLLSEVEILQEYTEAVKVLCNATNEDEFLCALEKARDIGLDLGDRIGVCAHIDIAQSIENAIVKASGAGNELALVFLKKANKLSEETICRYNLKKLRLSEGAKWSL